ncbi:hypothetical protein V2J09_012669 [Rumex salicifolius]
MRSGKRLTRSSAKYDGEAAEVSADRNEKVLFTDAQSSQDSIVNQPKRAKKLGNNGLKRTEKQGCGVTTQQNKLDSENGLKDDIQSVESGSEAAAKKSLQGFAEESKDFEECDWEEGLIQASDSATENQNGGINAITVDFSVTPESSNSKNVHRFTAEEKEVAERVHKVHLLCLIARGRIIDSACNDPLIQAVILSQLPPDLLKISEAMKLTAKALSPLVTWFHKNFRVRSTVIAKKPFPSALSLALGTQEGSPEEVVALSVTLFRALNLSARFVSILDVASVKPEREKSRVFPLDASGVTKDIFDSSTLMVGDPNQLVKGSKSSLSNGRKRFEAAVRNLSKLKMENTSRENEADKIAIDDVKLKGQSVIETRDNSDHAQCSKRKGDLEFELQMEMALSATAVAIPDLKSNVNTTQASSSNFSSPLKRFKAAEPSSSFHDISTAIGCEKVGAPLCWAEVYCNNENMTGKWVHVDVVHALIDGESRVEAAASACKKSLRYVVAFAGNGAKDVTRRYCAEWYKISPKRVNSTWWDGVLAPLKELESAASGGRVCVSPYKTETESSIKFDIAERASLEDMELETRALTEPLPTNQLAYRNHSLYAIERWLTKYQILYPKRPVVGFISGYAVYPRSCVQTLRTRERWLREALQVRANELPVKIVKSSLKQAKGQISELDDPSEVGSDGTVSLYGKWQTEPLVLQPAVNGRVPKNERGQIDVWSEKCLPPGTVHLRLPRLVPIVERLKIDFAPAMVGFEFRNGRSVPVYEGLVVCTEFQDAILEAYAEVEERREKEQKKKDERQALTRWYQLLSSIVTRRRLNESYGHHASQQTKADPPKSNNMPRSKAGSSNVDHNSCVRQPNVQLMHNSTTAFTGEHEHVFVVEDESVDDNEDGTLIRTKRCNCGFIVQVEEL